MRKPAGQIIATVIATIMIVVVAIALMKKDYDIPLFLTACSASLTSAIIYDAYIKDLVNPLENRLQRP